MSYQDPDPLKRTKIRSGSASFIKYSNNDDDMDRKIGVHEISGFSKFNI